MCLGAKQNLQIDVDPDNLMSVEGNGPPTRAGRINMSKQHLTEEMKQEYCEKHGEIESLNSGYYDAVNVDEALSDFEYRLDENLDLEDADAVSLYIRELGDIEEEAQTYADSLRDAASHLEEVSYNVSRVVGALRDILTALEKIDPIKAGDIVKVNSGEYTDDPLYTVIATYNDTHAWVVSNTPLRGVAGMFTVPVPATLLLTTLTLVAAAEEGEGGVA